MRNRCFAKAIRWGALFMALVLFFAPASGVVAAELRASEYLNSYSARTYTEVGGKVQVYFNVTADNDMDTLGAKYIYLYESRDYVNWTLVKTYTYTEYTALMAEDDFYHSGYVEYRGIPGRYYKAQVCIWAGRNGGGDERWIWTNVRQAP